MIEEKAVKEPNRRRHLEMLILCVLVLVASPLLAVADNERVAVRYLPGVLLPPTCMSREWFGVSCPGCGLTRSFVHIAHGNIVESLGAHRLGWLLMAAAGFQIPYRLALLFGSQRFELSNRISWTCSSVLIGLLLANWVLMQLGI